MCCPRASWVAPRSGAIFPSIPTRFGTTRQTSRIRWTIIPTAAVGEPSWRQIPSIAAGRRCATRPGGRSTPFIDECVDEEISLGDFVLTGGEIAAMAVTDAVCRMVPGVLADSECFEEESHFGGLLEYPQYTRPAVWHGRAIPEILTSGNHEKVRQWRRKQSLRRTRSRRPDMYEKLDLSSKQDKKLLKEMEAEDAADKG